MTMEERVEVAAKTLAGAEWDAENFNETLAGDDPAEMREMHRATARVVMAAAFPELTGPNPTHVIVPVEPSEEMLKAGEHGLHVRLREWDGLGKSVDIDMAHAYKSMLAAAD